MCVKPRGYTENPPCDMKSIPGEFIDRLTERTYAQSLTFSAYSFIWSFLLINKVYIFTSIILQGRISTRWKADWCKISARYLPLYLLTSTAEPSFGLQPVSFYNLMQSFHNKSCCSALKVWKTPNLSGCVLVKDVQNITVKLFNIQK